MSVAVCCCCSIVKCPIFSLPSCSRASTALDSFRLESSSPNKQRQTYPSLLMIRFLDHSLFHNFPYCRTKAVVDFRHHHLACLPETVEGNKPTHDDNDGDDEVRGQKPQLVARTLQMILPRRIASVVKEVIPQENLAILTACVVGLFTGLAVVLFNNTVHNIRDFFWDGIPSHGASWLREEPIEKIWKPVILVPVCGGVIVSLLNNIVEALDIPSEEILSSHLKAVLRPFLKAVAASATLGTGNSLGPEGPSVEIGASIGKGVSNLFESSSERRLSLVAAGSAAGISSGFNAAVGGCFFAVESVLWPYPPGSSTSLTNTTSMVIISAVVASVVSEIGLGSEPAFKVPVYDFRSPSELPLYLLLGVLCGFVSLTLSWCTSYMLTAIDHVHKATGISKSMFPILGGFSVGLTALMYPEILYWGFENVDILLESRPYVKGLPAYLLLQLVGIKIVATSFCRASGLVGGYYAPSLFIGAATGMAYGKFVSYAVSLLDPVFHLSILEVASPQAYGLVGMAATLAGVCQVPLTAVLLLFELTQDYRIVLPLLAAVGLSSWIASGQTGERSSDDKIAFLEGKAGMREQPEITPLDSSILSSGSSLAGEVSPQTNMCEFESSLYPDDSVIEPKDLIARIFVSQAMRTRYVCILMSTLLTDTVTLMLAEKQSCAMIVNNDNFLIGFLTLRDIQEFSRLAEIRNGQTEVEKLPVSELCRLNGGKCSVLWTATPDMNLLSALKLMNKHGVNELPVVSEHVEDYSGYPIGLLDRESISLTCRAVATREFLCLSSLPGKQ
ncbi:chloride channel protein CLC-e isoform X2 [Telopea speciosissima]|uniref:chloride channel protein CLC-e isoform X2 n=1 Tax=Telopea speciosissima TaxID=54955 RepID=UPI001CC58D42|nr:chloride channel protein CLC-e isoform X2 [Telopea speciosissima]